METKKLAKLSQTEVLIDFKLNTKCRATIHLTSLCSTSPIAFKIQTSSPHKFLVNPPTGILSPLSSAAFQVILKPQSHLPPSFPKSKSDRFLIKTNRTLDPLALEEFKNSQVFKLKVFFVGPFLLHHAVSINDADAVKNIIKRQRSIFADVSQRDAESLLQVATKLDNPEGMVNLLLEAGLKIDARVKSDVAGLNLEVGKGWSELHVAVAFDRKEEVVELVKGYGGPLDLRDKEGRTPLILAASKGSIGCAKVLLESGVDKDAKGRDGRTALHRAVGNGDRRMVEVLIEMGADPTVVDDRGRSAFDVARHKGHDEIVEILERGEQVLMSARRGEIERLESLLRSGATASYQDQNGLTALHAAAIKGYKDVVSLLLEFGVELDRRDKDDHTALHLAVESGSMDAVQVLVCRGADVNARNSLGATPLHIANVIGYSDISQFLISRGASSPPVMTTMVSLSTLALV